MHASDACCQLKHYIGYICTIGAHATAVNVKTATEMHTMLSVLQCVHLSDRRLASVCCTLCCLFSNGSHASASSIALLTSGAAPLSLQATLSTVHRAAMSRCIRILKNVVSNSHLLTCIACTKPAFHESMLASSFALTMLHITQRCMPL